jgi:septum site-determining protein MinD
MTAFIINISSGKGGSGKTLLASVLAEFLSSRRIRVLLVDLDIFARGLTALLYFRTPDQLRLIETGELAVSDIFFG